MAATGVWVSLLLIVCLPVVLIIAASAESVGLSIFGLLGLLILIGLLVAIVYCYQRWYYEVYFYDLTPDYIVIRKGPITPHEITIPYERVQDIYVYQDILDRLFGIYDVHLSSATISSGMAAHIDGVEKPAADGLRDLLMKTVNERICKNRMPLPPQS